MGKISYPKDIQLFFDEIVVKIKETLDPDFIIIAGSFGKGSWLYCEDELISDFELVFICNKRWSLKKKKRLLRMLNKQYSFDISLKGYFLNKIQNKVISNYSTKNPGYINLDFFDTFNDPTFLYIKNDKVLDIKCTNEEIPVWEAWRLYVNRMGDLLKLESAQNNNVQIIDYYWLKIFESTAGAYCIINKIYDKNISKRLSLFTAELIDNDIELNNVCKESFPIIKKALLARKDHNLLNFKIGITIDNRKLIVNSWMQYFEKKLIQQEQISPNNKNIFYKNYIANKELQKKYLEFNYRFNFLVSNFIRLIHHPKLINFTFKYYNHRVSWRHIILLSISSAFKEQSLGVEGLFQTRKIAYSIINKKSITNLSDKDFMKKIIRHWKILR